MESNLIIGIILFSVAIIISTTVIIFLRKRKQQTEPVIEIAVVLQTEENFPNEQTTSPTRITIAEDPSLPLVMIEESQSDIEYKKAKPLDIQSNSISKLGTLFQAAPALLIAGKTSSKRLMEVVINGDLVRAADGNGLRAFAMSAEGIKEHARLFEVSNLQNMVNAAAIWQIASVIVAQKHLADISRKLDEIKAGVQGISRFLDNQRKARIESTYQYLAEVCQAIQAGELPNSVRNQLEDSERDLLEIQRHLAREYQQKASVKIEHKETFGTEELTNDLSAKIDELGELAEDMALCIKTRIAAWYVLSLYPGEQKLKDARRLSIQYAIDDYLKLTSHNDYLVHEISGIDSFWNKKTTLEKRRIYLLDKCKQVAVQAIEQKAKQSRDAIQYSNQLMLENDRPTRIFYQIEDGVCSGFRQGE